MEELDLKQVFAMFWARKAQIILIILMFIMVGVFYTLFVVTPKYKASTTLVLAKIENEESTSVTQTEIQLNQKLIATYSELLKSKAVLGQTIENLGIDITEEDLRKNVTVSSVKNTELMQISVTHENKSYVDVIANEIASVFKEKVAEGMYSINNVHVVDQAEVATEPYNINHVRDVGIFIAIGMMFAAVYVVVANMLDNTVKESADIEKATGLVVLATIPRYDIGKGGNK